jgi:2-polyprenyl-3-methyl-5-hydroxy-6-metoxy-1,4-benzoquinol methylase
MIRLLTEVEESRLLFVWTVVRKVSKSDLPDKYDLDGAYDSRITFRSRFQGEATDGPPGGRSLLERQRRRLDQAGAGGVRHLSRHLNTPAFFEIVPDVAGLSGLDISCREGHNTRLLARRGARVTGIDISEVFVTHARQAEADELLGIDYHFDRKGAW